MSKRLPRPPQIAQNQNGGYFANGRAYGIEKKVEVAALIKDRGPNSLASEKLSLTAIARECKVSPTFVRNIRKELESGGLKDPNANIRDCARGPGSKCLDDLDELVLLTVYKLNPTTSLKTYASVLFQATGKVVDRTTISRFFNHGFEFRGSLRKPNYVPFDKFKPINIARLLDYRAVLMLLLDHDGHHRRLKFQDEKPLKGSELYCRHPRRNPITGEIPSVNVQSDFRNTYQVIGYCGVDTRTCPVNFEIHKGIIDSETFRASVYAAIQNGFLKEYDFLVMDNAAIHTGGACTDLRDRLWEDYRIVLLYLPTRAPELNPKELVWAGAVQKMKRMDIADLLQEGPNPVARAAGRAMLEFTHHDIAKLYQHCGYTL